MKGAPRTLARSALILSSDIVKKVTIPIRRLSVPITDPGGANGFGTAIIGDVPTGDLIFLASVLRCRLTGAAVGLAAAFAGNLAVGTAPTADATLAAGEVDIIPSVAFTTASSLVSVYTRYPGPTFTLAPVDNRNGALELNFNCFITDATLTAASSLIVDGVLDLAYIHMGTGL